MKSNYLSFGLTFLQDITSNYHKFGCKINETQTQL